MRRSLTQQLNFSVIHTSIQNAYKVHKKTFDFLLSIEVQQTFSFSFTLLRHYEMDASMLKTAVFELV